MMPPQNKSSKLSNRSLMPLSVAFLGASSPVRQIVVQPIEQTHEVCTDVHVVDRWVVHVRQDRQGHGRRG